MRRFQGTLLALVVLIVVIGVSFLLPRPTEAPLSTDPPPIYRFEKEDVVEVRIERADRSIVLFRDDEGWAVQGEPWRPSRSMVRRIAHQTHDLDARAVVADDPEDLSLYGLGDGAATVTLVLSDGQQIAFEAGDPNPSDVSYYIRPLPGDKVYIVKKSAVDFYGFDIEAFRERRFATFHEQDAERIDATVDGRRITVHLEGERSWKMTSPIEQDVEWMEIRAFLGRISSMKAQSFVADGPEELSRWGLAPPAHQIETTLATGEHITVLIGDVVEGTDPQERYIYRVEDDAVYTARDSFLEVFQRDLETYRRRTFLGYHLGEPTEAAAQRGDEEEIRITESSDDWHWPDGTPISGHTPLRLVRGARGLEARAFHDTPPAGTGLNPPAAIVRLVLDDAEHEIRLGAMVPGTERVYDPDAEPTDEEPIRPRCYATLDDDPVVYEIDADLLGIVDDVYREHARH